MLWLTNRSGRSLRAPAAPQLREAYIAMRLSIALTLLLASVSIHADGYLFKDGRFPESKATVLQLTSAQKQVVALYRKCSNCA